MSKWQFTSLGEICEITGGNSAPQGAEPYEGGIVPFVRMRDLGRYHFTSNLDQTDDKLTETAVQKYRMKIFKPGCLLFPRSGSVFLNHRAILGVHACIVSHIGVLQNFKPSIHVRFLYYFLQTFDMTRLSKKTTGVDSIAFSDVAAIKVPLPPLPEQERIACLLDEVEALRKLCTQANERMGEFVSALFHDMFGDPVKNERGWSIVPVNSFVKEFQAGRSILTDGLETEETKYWVLKVSAVTWGEYNPVESKPVPKEYSPMAQHFVKAGDLLFSRANTTELVGATVFVFDTPPNRLLSDKLWRFVWQNPEEIEPLYVWSLFQNKSIRYELGQRATGTGGSMKNISQPKVLSMKVPLPPLRLQREFAQRVQEAREIQSRQAQSAERIESLYQSMLSRAFSGEL